MSLDLSIFENVLIFYHSIFLKSFMLFSEKTSKSICQFSGAIAQRFEGLLYHQLLVSIKNWMQTHVYSSQLDSIKVLSQSLYHYKVVTKS